MFLVLDLTSLGFGLGFASFLSSVGYRDVDVDSIYSASGGTISDLDFLNFRAKGFSTGYSGSISMLLSEDSVLP